MHLAQQNTDEGERAALRSPAEYDVNLSPFTPRAASTTRRATGADASDLAPCLITAKGHLSGIIGSLSTPHTVLEQFQESAISRHFPSLTTDGASAEE